VSEEKVHISCFTYDYPYFKGVSEYDWMPIVAKQDIAAMKIFAIIGRATQKDYVDIDRLLNEYSFSELFSFFVKKFGPMLDEVLIKKALVYFDDIEESDLVRKENNLTWEKVKISLLEKFC